MTPLPPIADAVFEARFAALREIVRERFADAPACHDYDHTLRVLRNAEQLAAQLPEADFRIVRLAALLHDIARADEIAAAFKGFGLAYVTLDLQGYRTGILNETLSEGK